MPKVAITKSKLDALAAKIATKAGATLPLTLDEMEDEADALTKPSGTKQITANGQGIDVTEFAAVDVAVPSSQPTLETVEHVQPSENSQTITPGAGYDGLSSVQIDGVDSEYVGSDVPRRSSSDLTASGATVTVPAGYYGAQASKAVVSGSEGTPVATKGSVNNHSVTVTPSVTNGAGYISGGTRNGTGVNVSASELVSGSETITENGTHDVTNLAQVVVNVPTGSAKNIQAYMGYATVTATSYTATAVTITVKKTGTYNVSWLGWRNTNSGTSGSQLYRTRNGTATAIGSANTTFQNTYGHSVSLTNQSFQEGDILVVRARARSTSYVMAVGNLVIEEV